jgi:predicted RNase H-like HicB family nuclease
MKKLKAKEIAKKPYVTIVYEDKTTTGEKIYLAIHPEFVGCMAQGETEELAVKELEAVTIEYINSLIEDHQPIPEPLTKSTDTSAGKVIPKDDEIIANEPKIEDSFDFLKDLESAVQPNTRKVIATLISEEVIQAA